MAKSAGKVRIGCRRGAPCCVFFMRLENLPRPWTIVRGVGAAGSRSRPNHSGICSPTPTAQGTPITRAAGGIDPPAAWRETTFLRCRGAIHQPCGQGGIKPPCRPSRQAARLIRPSPRRGCCSPPLSTRHSYLRLQGPDQTLAGPSTSLNGPARTRIPRGA